LTPSDHPQEVPLNDYAKRVAPLLVAAFPEHGDEIAVDDDGDVSMEIPCPSGSVDAGLSVFTSNGDVVVAFHTHHAHFSDWHRTGSDNHIHEAMHAAHDVIAERWIVVSRYWWRWSAAPTTSTWRAPEDAPAAVRPVKVWARRLCLGKVTLRSWNGSYDAG